jgi:hypothetical protein
MYGGRAVAGFDNNHPLATLKLCILQEHRNSRRELCIDISARSNVTDPVTKLFDMQTSPTADVAN